MTLLMVHEYIRPDLCAPCGGKCCKSLPGINAPEDFGATKKEMLGRIVEALKTGRYSIDWYEGDPRPVKKQKLELVRFVRPATKHAVGKLLDPSWGGECTFLTENGCSFEHDQRPFGCRSLEPGESVCIDRGGEKAGAAMRWIPFQGLLNKAIKIIQDDDK